MPEVKDSLSLAKLARQAKTYPSVQGPPKSGIINWYYLRVGKKSLILQMFLAGWTICVSVLGVAMVVLSIVGSNSPTKISNSEWNSMGPGEREDALIQRARAIEYPHESEKTAIAGTIFSLSCLAAVWLAVSVPLVIASICTISKA